MSDDTPAIDGADFRTVLGHYPTGVTVVTADDDGPCGMVIGSFGSVSLDPPLVQFMPAKTSGTWARIEKSGSYCVNVLGADQLGLCNSFFDKSKDPFDGFAWRPGVTGSPVIDGCLCHIDCEIHEAVDAGDHAKAQTEFRVAAKRLDQAASKNLIHRNAAARSKSRLNKLVKSIAG